MSIKSTLGLALAATLGASLMVSPAVSEPVEKPKFGATDRQLDAYTREKVRERQVQQTRRSGGPLEAVFHPLTGAWNQYVR